MVLRSKTKLKRRSTTATVSEDKPPQKKKRPVEEEAPRKTKPKAAVKKKRMFNIDKQKKDLQRGGRNEFFKFPAGRTTLLIVQQPDGGPWYERRKEAFLPNLNADGGSTAISPKSFDENAECPMHDARNALYDRNDVSAKKLLEDFGIAEKFYVNAFVKQKDNTWLYQIAQLPKTMFKEIAQVIDLELEEEEIDVNGNVANPPVVSPTRLRVIRVEKTGEKLSTEYAVHVLPNEQKMPQDMLDKVQDLQDYMKAASVEELRQRVCLKLGVDALDELEESQTFVEDDDVDDEEEEWEDDADDDEVDEEAPECFGDFPKPTQEMKKKGGCKKCTVRSECRQVKQR